MVIVDKYSVGKHGSNDSKSNQNVHSISFVTKVHNKIANG